MIIAIIAAPIKMIPPAASLSKNARNADRECAVLALVWVMTLFYTGSMIWQTRQVHRNGRSSLSCHFGCEIV
ncbi:hypothetical protein [Sphingomonas lacunae]|uniref:hypothetical protein n=1 Tax=Sphingomonas lacunae TaxID=2698828 RepID=UPI001FEAC6A4|nr:hypothetical protein [Sphingomonas lacunae]